MENKIEKVEKNKKQQPSTPRVTRVGQEGRGHGMRGHAEVRAALGRAGQGAGRSQLSRRCIRSGGGLRVGLHCEQAIPVEI